MAATRGRLEGRVTVPTGGWTATVGGSAATIAAGKYFASSLLGVVAAAFAAAAGTTCSVTASLGEAGTGIVTIVFGSAKAIAWASTDLRDILGWTANSSSATTHVGSLHLRGAWLPTCPYKAPNQIAAGDAGWKGWREGDIRSSINHSGYAWTHMGAEKVATWLAWPQVARARTWAAHELVVNASFERFHRDCIWGVPTWGSAGGPIRFYPDAGASNFAAYRVPDAASIRPEAFFPDWAGGPWTVRLPRLVRVAAGGSGNGDTGGAGGDTDDGGEDQ